MNDTDSQHDFTPPADLKLPAELLRATPRPLPPEFDENFHQTSRKRSTLYLIGSGILCMMRSFLPFVQTIGIYFMPVLILFWIGLALLGIAVWVWFSRTEVNRVATYVTDGEARFAKVNEMVKIPTMTQNGSVTLKAFVANVALNHPSTGQPFSCELKSKDFIAEAKLAPKFRVGDWVPVVWLSNQFESTLQIYDFLEPTPANSLSRETAPLWKTAVGLAVAAGFVVGIFWSIYSLGRYMPIDFGLDEARIPLIIGTLLAIVTTVVLMLLQSRKKKAVKTQNELAIKSGGAMEMEAPDDSLLSTIGMSLLYGFVFLILANLIVFGCAISVNSLFDQSPPKSTPVEITQLTETIHKLIFREYKIEYKMDGVDDELELMSTPEHMDTFEFAAGIANVRDGYFGWRWVDTIDPVVIARDQPDEIDKVDDPLRN